MASSARGRSSTRLLYKVKSNRASDGSVVYSCIFSCLDDVEHHRHRRNPFDPKYIQAALSSFDELGRNNFDKIVTREEVEAASTSVHVRMELIKSMKDSLIKLTGEAVKHFKVVARKASKKKSNLDENKDCRFEVIAMQQKSHICNQFEDDSLELYQIKFGQSLEALQDMRDMSGSFSFSNENTAIMGSINLELAKTMDALDSCLNGNPNFLSDDELCFSINKEMTEISHDMLKRAQRNFKTSVDCEDNFADLTPFKGFISPITKDLVLDFETSQHSSENVRETASVHDHEARVTSGTREWEAKIPDEATSVDNCHINNNLFCLHSKT